MRQLEKILVVLIIIGFLFKLGLLPGTSAIVGLAVASLSTFYFTFSFLLFNNIRLRYSIKGSSYQNVSLIRILGAIGTGIALSIVLMGILFDFLMLPGAGPMLIVGSGGLALVFLVILFKVLTSGMDSYYNRILWRLIPIAFLGLLMYLTPVEKQIDFFYRNHPDYAKAYKEYIQNPENEELLEKLEEEREKM